MARYAKVLAVALLWSASLITASAACLEGSYARLSECREPGVLDQILQVVFGSGSAPMQIAVVAGVSNYPNMPSAARDLPPVREDVRKLRETLFEDLEFDEVIALENEDFSLENLRYLFQEYLPVQLDSHPGSRVLFAFSGHGADFRDTGYLLLPSADKATIETFSDAARNGLDLDLLKVVMKPTVQQSQHFLVLLNACKGGHFLSSAVQFGDHSLEEPGAHGITAGRASDSTYAREAVGSGSVFFELVEAALRGDSMTLGTRTLQRADRGDGILTALELASFLQDGISYVENFNVEPKFGPLSGEQPDGAFFFVTDKTAAEQTLRSRFPEQYARVFGGDVPPGAGGAGGSGTGGGSPPSPEVVEAVEHAWDALDRPSPDCREMWDYVGGGLRALYCALRGSVNYRRIEELAGMPVFESSPHRDYTFTFSADDFGHYNRDFVIWAKENLLPSPDDHAFISRTQPLYDMYLRQLARSYHRVYVQFSRNLGHFKREREYLMDMIAGRRPWSYLAARWQNNELRTILGIDVEAEGLNWYHVDTAIRFWQRRSIDGTADVFFEGLEKLMAIYDADYLESAPRPLGSPPHLPPPGAIPNTAFDPSKPWLPEPSGDNFFPDNLMHAPL